MLNYSYYAITYHNTFFLPAKQTVGDGAEKAMTSREGDMWVVNVREV